MDQVLRLDSVTKYYGSQAALNQVSLSIAPGRVVGLLGPNGSGKTTIIKIINGLLADYTGKVDICGFEPGVESKAMVSYLPDKMNLPEWLKVKQALGVYRDFYPDFHMERARELLESLKVPEEKRIAQLSKGMKEKLQLTVTMARQAALYVLDEPIAGVDPASREVIMDTILKNFNRSGSILLSTHIISDVEEVFDDIIFLKDGQISLAGEAVRLREEKGMSIDQLFREVYRC